MNVSVKKIKFVGLNSERRKLCEALKRSESFELSKIEKINGTDIKTDIKSRDELQTLIARVKFCIDVIENSAKEFGFLYEKHLDLQKKGEVTRELDYKVEVIKKQSVRPEIDYDNYQLVSTRQIEIMDIVDTLEKTAVLFNDMTALEAKHKLQAALVKPYANFPLPFDKVKSTKNTSAVLGIASAAVRKKLDELSEETGLLQTESFDYTEQNKIVYLTFHKEIKNKVNEVLSTNGFIKCGFDYNRTAKELIDEHLQKLESLYYQRLELLKETASGGDKLKLLKIYYDYLSGELETVSVQEKIVQTARAYIMTGWIPVPEAERVKQIVDEANVQVVYELTEPDENDLPPTYLVNSKLVAPFEGLVTNFSAPAYKEFDPTRIMAFFYFLFLGIMVGDAGYGIVLFVATLILLKKGKFEKGFKNLVMIMCMGGISAIFWGAIFGGWFGLSITGADGESRSIIPGFIDPINDTFVFIGLCLALGVVHIITGLCIKFYKLASAGSLFDAVCDAGFTIIMFLGGIIIALCMLLGLPGIIQTIGIAVAVSGVGGIVLTNGRKSKKILGKILGGFGGLYGLINYLSDLLSYIRLFALGLVGAVIGMVANTLGGLLFGLPFYIGYPLGFILAAVLHAFNLALGLVSAYVHNSRLQFVEFFSKFYDGGGKMFVPLGSRTKYVIVKNR